MKGNLSMKKLFLKKCDSQLPFATQQFFGFENMKLFYLVSGNFSAKSSFVGIDVFVYWWKRKICKISSILKAKSWNMLRLYTTFLWFSTCFRIHLATYWNRCWKIASTFFKLSIASTYPQWTNLLAEKWENCSSDNIQQ